MVDQTTTSGEANYQEPSEASADLIANLLNGEPATPGKDSAPSDELTVDDVPDDETVSPDEESEGGDNDDEASADDESTEEPESGRDAELYEVTVDGKPEKVTRKELLAGYSRQRDYTKKTQQLAAERQQVEQDKARYAEALAQVTRHVQQDPIIAEGQKTDWARLANEDPAGFVQKQFAYNNRLQELQRMQQEQQVLLQQHLAKKGEEEAAKLLQDIPEWKEPAKAEQGIKMLSEYLLGQGFTEQELKGFTDSRAYKVAYDAARYRKLMAAKQNVKAQQVQAAPSKTTVSPSASTNGKRNVNTQRIKQLDSRAARTGSMEDAVDAVMARL